MAKKPLSLLLAPMLFAVAGQGVAADAKIPQALLNNDQVSKVTLSPDGDHVAYVAPVENTDVLIVAKANDLSPVFITKMGSERYVGSIAWANDERLLLWPAKNYGPEKVKRLTGTVQAFNYDGSENIRLWGFSRTKLYSRNGYLMLENRLADDPEHVMVTSIDGNYVDVGTRTLQKMNIYTGRSNPVERSTLPQADFVVNDNGKALLQWGTGEQSNTLVSFKNQQDEWQSLPNAGQYQTGWIADGQHLVFKLKGEGERFVKFNRITMEQTELDPITVAGLELEGGSDEALQTDLESMIAFWATKKPYAGFHAQGGAAHKTEWTKPTEKQSSGFATRQ
jgi:hypothetical protein